jgi:hypothetical protein
VTKAKHIVVARRGRGEKITIAEYLLSLLAPLVERDYEKELAAVRPKGTKGER